MSKQRRLTTMVVLLLLLLGAGVISLRWSIRRRMIVGQSDRVWRLSYDIEIRTEKTGENYQVSLPLNTSRSRVFRRSLSDPELLSEMVRYKYSKGESLVLTSALVGFSRMRENFDIHVSPTAK